MFGAIFACMTPVPQENARLISPEAFKNVHYALCLFGLFT
jgi:hypothetical protein